MKIGRTISSRPGEILHGLRDLNKCVPEAKEDGMGLGICGNEWEMIIETYVVELGQSIISGSLSWPHTRLRLLGEILK